MLKIPPTIGDRVSWTFRHHLNSKSSTLITREGFLLKIPNDYQHKKATVHFDRNKHPSKVWYTELRRIPTPPSPTSTYD